MSAEEELNDRCPSCGVAYIDHLGLIGTCRKLQEAVAELNRYRVGDLMAERDRYRKAITQYLKGMDSCCCEACQMFRQALRGEEECK